VQVPRGRVAAAVEDRQRCPALKSPGDCTGRQQFFADIMTPAKSWYDRASSPLQLVRHPEFHEEDALGSN